MKIPGPLVVLFLGSLIAAVFVAAEDSALVKAAKEEKARRAQVGPAKKTFTNKDIQAYLAKHKSPPPRYPQSQTQTAPEEQEPDILLRFKEKEEYWRGRYKEVAAQINDAQKKVDTLTVKLKDLNNKATGMPGSFQIAMIGQDIQITKDQLEQAKTELGEANQKLEDLMDEGRKDGALPGWFRD
jgi:chromosome segregation ATPase